MATVTDGGSDISGYTRRAVSSRAGHSWPSTIPEALERAASTHNGVVFADARGDGLLSYRELRHRGRRAAGTFRRMGIGPGDVIGFLVPTSPELLICMVAAWEVGAVPAVLPTPPHHRSATPAHELAVAAGATILVVPGVARDVRSSSGHLPTVGTDEIIAGGPYVPGPTRTEPDDPALVQFTAGRTGPRRPVVFTHGQALAGAGSCGRILEVDTAADVFASWLPLSDPLGMSGMLLPALATSASLVLQAPGEWERDPVSWLHAITRYEATITAASCPALGRTTRYLNGQSDLDLSSVRILLNGGEPIRPEIASAFVELAGRHGLYSSVMRPAYVVAEASFAVAVGRRGERYQPPMVARHPTGGLRQPHEMPVVSAGIPVDDVVLTVRDASSMSVPPGIVGEITLAGAGVGTTHGGPTPTGELSTGDLGFFDGEHLVVVGARAFASGPPGRVVLGEEYEFHTGGVRGVGSRSAVAFPTANGDRMVVVVELPGARDQVERITDRVGRVLMRHFADGPPVEVAAVPQGAVPRSETGKRLHARCRAGYEQGHLPVLARSFTGAA